MDKQQKNSTPYKTIIQRLWICFGSLVLGIVIYLWSVAVNVCNLYGALPSLAVLENPKTDYSSELYSADGVLLGKYFRYNRTPITYQDLSPNLVNALLATEDYQFQKHQGIYLTGIVRAIVLSVILQKKKGGGSTITQQLAKNLFKTRSQQYKGILSHVPLLDTFISKTKEWIVAIQIERAYTKQEIITMYLNTVPFGNNAYGIQVAAQTFFNTTPDKLTINQAALLIGLLRAPSYYDPIKHPKRALERRNLVLRQLNKLKFIPSNTYQQHTQEPLGLQFKVDNQNQGIATYFRATIRHFLLDWARHHGYDLFEDGLKIYTTIDSRVQQHAEVAMAEHMQQLQKKFDQHWGSANPWIDEQGNEIPFFLENIAKKKAYYQTILQNYGADSAAHYLHQAIPCNLFSWQGTIDSLLSPLETMRYNKRLLHAGLMAMDPTTGHIKAWVGGINFKHFKYDHVMQGKRQPGSTFKPIVYAAAIDNGYSPCYEVVDAPVTFTLPDGRTWTPKNTNNAYTGKKMTLRQALGKSVNAVTAHITKQIGIELIIDYAKRLGIRSPLVPVPALCLGASDVSVYELTGAYSTFVNKGIWIEPIFVTRIEDKHGRVLEDFVPKQEEALSEKTAALMLYMLKGSIEENGTFKGISQAIKADNEICGKTGTTSNHSDAWCMGIIKDLCTGIWVGGENRCIRFKSLALGQGAAAARPMWEKFILRLYADPTLTYKKGSLSATPLATELTCTPTTADTETPSTTDTANRTQGSITHSEKPISLEDLENPDEVF